MGKGQVVEGGSMEKELRKIEARVGSKLKQQVE